MKFVRNTLLGLYVNLFIVILLLVRLLQELTINNAESPIQRLLIIAMVISLILNVIFAVINIINTIRLYKNREYNSMRTYMKVLKLGSIPYFVLNFIIYFLLFMLFFAASRGLIMFTPTPLLFLIPIFFTYLNVLFTSFYGLGFIATISKEKKLSKGKMLIHVLLQLCFVLDVISTIILLREYKVDKQTDI